MLWEKEESLIKWDSFMLVKWIKNTLYKSTYLVMCSRLSGVVMLGLACHELWVMDHEEYSENILF